MTSSSSKFSDSWSTCLHRETPIGSVLTNSCWNLAVKSATPMTKLDIPGGYLGFALTSDGGLWVGSIQIFDNPIDSDSCIKLAIVSCIIESEKNGYCSVFIMNQKFKRVRSTARQKSYEILLTNFAIKNVRSLKLFDFVQYIWQWLSNLVVWNRMKS